MALNNFVNAIPISVLDSADFDGEFVPFNSPGGLPNACSIIRIVNTSNVTIFISYDAGVTTHEVVASGESLQLSLQNNSSPNNYQCLMKKGLIVYCEGDAGEGDVYLVGYYQSNQ